MPNGGSSVTMPAWVMFAYIMLKLAIVAAAESATI